MPSLANAVLEQRNLDEPNHPNHSNTRIPGNWKRVGMLPTATRRSQAFAHGLGRGPELSYVYECPHADRRIYVDACSNPIPVSRMWRHTTSEAPHEYIEWVRAWAGYPIASHQAMILEQHHQERLERRDPARRAERNLAQARRLAQQRRQRRAVQQAARVASAAPDATEATVARGIANAMQAVHNLVRPLRPNPEAAAAAASPAAPAASPAAPVAAAPAPALDLASAWALLQEQVPGLLRAQAEQAAAQAAAAQAAAAQAAAAAEASRTVTCAICMDAMPEMVFTQCGHAVSCQACTHKLEGWASGSGQQHRKCPVCRRSGSVIRIHFG